MVLPKSVTPARIESNLLLVKLDEEDLKTLNDLHKNEGKTQRFVKPEWNTDLKFANW